MAACTFFEGSACGVIAMVTMFGLGGAGGAVYVAEVDIAPPTSWVVITVSTPQAVPLHPGPESVQERFGEGFEPATGVSVDAMMPEVPDVTARGAESCREKLLVTVSCADVCFDGSATLCAVTVM